MTLLVIRHTYAGDRDVWTGDDRLRPVSGRGVMEADALVELLSGWPLERILTSPYVRCRQSVEPLADARGITIEEVDNLAEGTPADVVRDLVARLGTTDAALCSHGDVIGDLIQGLDVTGPAPRWPKASTWVLEVGPDGTVKDAQYLPPPDVG